MRAVPWPGSRLRIAASAPYVAGTFLVTMACNGALNEVLEQVPPESAAAAQRGAQFVPQ
jgi:uncharacterized membrane protein